MEQVNRSQMLEYVHLVIAANQRTRKAEDTALKAWTEQELLQSGGLVSLTLQEGLLWLSLPLSPSSHLLILLLFLLLSLSSLPWATAWACWRSSGRCRGSMTRRRSIGGAPSCGSQPICESTRTWLTR